MPGTRSQAGSICDTLQGFSPTAVTANQVLWKYIAPASFRFGGIKFYAETAGTGAGNTVVDIQVNGTTIFTTTANQPTLAATSTGEFANGVPNVGAVRAGDRITMVVLSVSTTGHANLYGTVALLDV